jgi:hypothetical protein
MRTRHKAMCGCLVPDEGTLTLTIRIGGDGLAPDRRWKCSSAKLWNQLAEDPHRGIDLCMISCRGKVKADVIITSNSYISVPRGLPSQSTSAHRSPDSLLDRVIGI